MPTPPVSSASLAMNIAQFKGQALASIFSADDVKNIDQTFTSILDKYSAQLSLPGLPTSTVPTGLDSSQPFSTPGQNMVTVLNRVEVSFKAQYSELEQLTRRLKDEQGVARKLTAFDANSSNADIKAALGQFVAAYNDGVQRFAPEVAQGGILEGSWEARRARFATEREISYLLTGSSAGVKGGLASMGITTDKKTGLASIDESMLDAALAKDKSKAVFAIADFGKNFDAMVDSLTAADHSQLRQMDNLDRAVHWIMANREDVQKEFGPGAAATPNEAFARAAARYDQIAKLKASS
jgi:hypothetical protein